MESQQPTYQELLKRVSELESKAKSLKIVADNSTDLLIFRSKSGTIKYINNSIEKFTGYKSEDVLYGIISEKNLVHPDDYDQYYNNINLTPKQKIIDGLEFRIIKKDGTHKWMKLCVTPVIVAGEFVGSWAIIKEINNNQILSADDENDLISDDVIDIERVKSKDETNPFDAQKKSSKISENKYFQIINLLSDGVVIHHEGKIVFANEAAEKIVKAEKSGDLKGRLFLDLVHPNFKYIVEHRIKKCIKENAPVKPLQEVFIGFDQKPVHVFVTATPIDFESKLSVLTVFTDISKIVDTETELIEAKEKADERGRKLKAQGKELEDFFACAIDLLSILDSNGVFQKLNKEWENVFGFTTEKLLGRKFMEFVHPDDYSESEALIAQLLEQKKVINFVNRFRCSDGNYKWIEWKSSLHGNKIYTSARDITDKIRTNQELIAAKEKAEESEQKLRISEEKLRLKLDFILTPQVDLPEISLVDLVDLDQLQEIQDIFTLATGVASVITDKEGFPITRQSNFNGVCSLVRATEKGRRDCTMSDRLIGERAAYTKRPIIEQCRGCGFVDAGAPILVGNKLIAIWMIGQTNIGNVDSHKIASYAEEIEADKEKMVDEYKKINNMPIEQFHKITNLLWIMARELSSLAYNNLLLAKKIEEQKDFELNLIHAKEKAEESGRLKTAFIQNISHEIRTPMNAIMGFSTMLAKQGINDEKRKSYVKIIQNSCSQLLSIVSDILTISSVETRQEKVNIQKVCINDIIVELHSVFKTSAGSQNLSIFSKKALTDDESTIYTDKTKLTQILTNLITNSLKFTHSGFIEFGYEYRAEMNGSSPALQFYVKDTGIGIPYEQQDKIFERFRQADIAMNKKYGGTGLGLSISKAFVEMLGGKIWVQSEPMAGSVFQFTLPYKPVNANVVPIIKSSTKGIADTVLIVEDEEDNYLFFEEILSSKKIKLLHAKNGLEAVTMFKMHDDIGLILMDLKLPVMDGAEATEKIRSISPNIPIVAQTAYALESEIKRFSKYGFNDYLTKPIDEEKLIAIIEKYIRT